MTNELELLALLIVAWSLVIYYTVWRLTPILPHNAIYALAASRQNAAAFHEMFGRGPPRIPAPTNRFRSRTTNNQNSARSADVKTQVLAALTALVAVAALGAPASAQNPAGANAVKYGVAVVDINYIFKNHAKFIAAMDGMKTDFQAVETDVKGKQQQIMQAQEQQKTFTPGSPEFKQLDEQIVRMTAGLQVDVTQKRKELVDREAKIYFDTYVEVTNTIKLYAEHKGIGMVLRFNGEEADPNNRESILRAINKAVHFQNSIDITPDVLAYLNRSAATADTRGGAGGAQAAPR